MVVESVSAEVLCVQVLPDDEMMADLYIMAVEVGCSINCCSCSCSMLRAGTGHWALGCLHCGVSVIVSG